MSGDEPTSHGERMRAEAQRTEEILKPVADKLGLKLTVKYDPTRWGLVFYGSLKHPAVSHTIDEEAFFTRGQALPALLQRVLEDVQLKLHEDVAKIMSETNVCGACFRLSKEDKRTLHDMLMDATSERTRHYDPHRTETNQKKLDEYQALINRLFK